MTPIRDPVAFCDTVRQRLACCPTVEADPRPEIRVDPEGLQEAAVLMPLVRRHGALNVLLTRRSESLSSHAGQISFPGGRLASRIETPLDAALRESQEEVGLEPRRVEVLGRMAQYPTVTGFIIHPFVGYVDDPGRLRPQPSEVAEIFEVPLSFFLDERNHKPHEIEYEGCNYRLHAMPYGDYYIWGVTAALLRAFYQHLRGEPADNGQGTQHV